MRHTPLLVLSALALAIVTSCAPDAGDLTMGSSLVDVGAPSQVEQAVHNVCPGGATTFGIDVSKWQGNINWGAVAGAGVKFALIRVSDGTGYIDEKFDANWAGAQQNGVVRGVYQFFRSNDDPIAQADLLLARMGPLGPGDLPPVADVESTDGVDNGTRAARLHAWLDHIQQATGVVPMIYTGGYFWQDNVGQDFSQYPLWHAGYTGGSCPSTIANQWPDWKMWQFTSSGSVAGIGGNVDENRFNGSEADLQAFTHANQQPRGYIDAVTCDGVAGWSQDPDAPDSAIPVDVYLDGPAGSGAPGFRTVAGNARDDLCSAIGSCAHGYVLPIPMSYRDGAAHTAFAYGLDTAGGNNPQLAGSGASFTCAAPALPFQGILRHVGSPAVMTAWGFAFTDVAPYPDLSQLAVGAAFMDAPRLVQSDGPAVYVVDNNGTKRHVVSPTSLAAWHLDVGAIEHIAQADLDALPEGPALPDAPFLLRTAGDPGVYVLDVEPLPPAIVPGSEGEGEGAPVGGEGEGSIVGEGEGSSIGGEGEGAAGGEGEGEGSHVVVITPPPAVDGGCAAVHSATSSASWAAPFALLLAVARRRRV